MHYPGCIYAGRNNSIPIDDWVNDDIHLDPEGVDGPNAR